MGAIYDVKGTSFEVADGWRYNAPTTKGDCGGLLVMSDTRLDGKIGGIHVCGSESTATGWSILLVREDIEDIVGKFENVMIPPEFKHVIEPQDGEIDISPKVCPVGDFTYVGVVHRPVFVSTKTTLQKTPIFDEVYEHVTEPSVLSPRDRRLEVKGSPLIRAIEKYGKPAKPFRPDMLKRVKDYMAEEILNFPTKYVRRVLTDHEAIYGIDGDLYMKSIEWDTSTGYPYRLLGLNDKRRLIEDKKSLFWKRLRERETLAKEGEMYDSIWIDSLKDEKRTFEKIKMGKTRAFCIAPMDHTIMARKYFGSFLAYLMENHNKFFLMVGVNPESFEWNDMYRVLMMLSACGADLDYKNFDGPLDPEVMGLFLDLANKWYEDSFDLIRLTLFEEVLHTTSIVIDLVYTTHCGDPSGCGLTSILNSACNAVYIRMAWMAAREKEKLNSALFYFSSSVKDRNYGDDTLLAIKEGTVNVELMIQFLLDHGIHATSADKKSVIALKPVREMSFLKREFVEIEEFKGVVFPRLSFESIGEMMNWVRAGDPEYMLLENLQPFQYFLAHYGKEKYEIEMEKVKRVMRRKQIDYSGRTFDYYTMLYSIYD